MMISPDKVANMALLKENENHRFRRFLKNHSDEEKLDAYS